MVQPVKEAAAVGAKKAASEAAPATDALFSDDLLFLDFSLVPCPPPSAGGGDAAAAAAAAEQSIFQEILDQADDGLAGLGLSTVGGGNELEAEEEEEELEWLSNKDAFPSLETSFDILSHSGNNSGTASIAGAGAERSSPVCVLAATESFPVPGRPRTKGRRRRRRVLSGLALPAAVKLSKKVGRPGTSMTGSKERRRCLHCHSEETPQWRAGPEGPKTLCNACGVRYKSGRLVPEYRPASSPTFSPAIHSNSHRRILEMRRRKSTSDGRRSTLAAPAAPPLA